MLRKKPKKKFLIGDWLSIAGYEATSVIFVSLDKRTNSGIDDHRYATYCQRAKAKLVIYRAPNAGFGAKGSDSEEDIYEPPRSEQVKEELHKILDNWVHEKPV